MTNFLKTGLIGCGLLLCLSAHSELIINTQPNYQVFTDPTIVEISQIPSTESTKKLMEVLRVDKQIETLIQAKQVANVASGELKLPKINKEELTQEQLEIRQRIEQILSQTGEILGGSVEDSLSQNRLEQVYIHAVQNYYTQNEVDALIAFYDTPMGQSILDKQPKVTQEFLQSVVPQMSQVSKNKLEIIIPQIFEVFATVD